MLPPLVTSATVVAVGWLRSNRLRLLALLVCVLLPLIIFGEIADEVREQEPIAFDEAILLFMQRQAADPADWLMLTASVLGSGLLVGAVDLLVWAVLLARRQWVDSLFWALATGGAALINLLAKLFYGRLRPDLWPSLAPETSFSFPSGHAMQSMALAAALVVMLWPIAVRWWVLALGGAFTLVVGVSRVYLGVHYPSDVLAGWAASLAWVVGLSFLFYRHAIRTSERVGGRTRFPR